LEILQKELRKYELDDQVFALDTVLAGYYNRVLMTELKKGAQLISVDAIFQIYWLSNLLKGCSFSFI